MPRKKPAKRAPKRHGASNPLTSVLTMEKDLLKAPAKIAATLHKEINTHQQKENKSAKILNKIKDKVKHAETRSKEAEAASTPLAKKQFKKWKKAYAIATKMCDQAAKRHESISTTLETLLKKQAKFNALQKHMNQFEKDWVKQSKNTSNVKSKKPTKNKASSANQHGAHAEKMEVVVDNAGLNEPTELAS
jgi:hypothetical protein